MRFVIVGKRVVIDQWGRERLLIGGEESDC